MKCFRGTVTLHNGKFERTYGVQVSGSSWHTACKVAVMLATKAMKDHLAAMGVKKRIHVETVLMHLTYYKPLTMSNGEKADPLPCRAWLASIANK